MSEPEGIPLLSGPLSRLGDAPVAVRLYRRADGRVRAGHPWIFSNEIDGDVANLPRGGAVDVYAADGKFLGRGTANPRSLISIRLLTRDRSENIDSVDFFKRALGECIALRERIYPGRRSLRLCAGEGDGLPGLIIDRYEDVLAVQLGSLGMDLRKDLIATALQEICPVRGAVLRNEAQSRSLEGLPRERSLWYGEIPEQVQFFEGPVRLAADVSKGQKTGFFFDQAENRAFALRTAGRGRVLDVFSNTGAWGIGALLAGADSATFVEVNAATCALIVEGLRLNEIAQDRGRILAEDAKVALEGLLAKGERFEAVFLDPPAFAKSRKHAPMALRAYRQYNALSMRLVVPGGLLFTSSCSFHVHEDRFLDEVAAAAREVGRWVRILRRGEQAPDHPVHPGVPETRYLKHYVLQLT